MPIRKGSGTQFPQMGVTKDHSVKMSWWQLLIVVHMTMSEQYLPAFINQQRVGCLDREMKQHLVNFRVAVAPDSYYIVGQGIEPFCHSLGIQALWHSIAGTIVEDITKKQQHITVFATVDVEYLVELCHRSVDIGQKKVFDYNGLKICNFEMESSALAGLSTLMGHKAMTCCMVIANRRALKAEVNYKNDINDLIELVLERI